MNFDAWHRLSLRRTLLLALLPGMLLVVGGELWLTWRTTVEAADAAYDRSLLGAIKSVDANISTDSGGLAVELPYRLLEFFELTASGRVYYRVATEDGLVEIGNANLPLPPEALVSGQPHFANGLYFGEPVRVGSYARVLNPPIGGAAGEQRVVIQVAETLGPRTAFTRALVLRSVQRDLLLIVLAMGLLAAAVAWALRPLRRLRDEVQARSPQDLAPVDVSRIPADVRPLVDAINRHVVRHRELLETRRRFIDDASHQLRTPLATLATQVGYALREPDAARLHDALLAVRSQIEEATRQTNQMLSLARSDAEELSPEALDLVELAAAVSRQWWPPARDRGVDLGFETACERLDVLGHGALLREALSNLLHNAIRYTSSGDQVTVVVRRAGDRAAIDVVDTGPGISPAELPRAGERFFRASNAAQPGSGLGLAIVRAVAERHGGSMRLAAGRNGRGVIVTLELPAKL